ncbi:hypothetical protein [Actinomadura spongiicola]|nr:hypothetical protein [Actinomadura spongiicola]
MTRIETMDAQDLPIIGECLNAALQGPFFPGRDFHYPHGQREPWHEYISVSPREVAGVLARWLGQSKLDDSAGGFFDRLR